MFDPPDINKQDSLKLKWVLSSCSLTFPLLALLLLILVTRTFLAVMDNQHLAFLQSLDRLSLLCYIRPSNAARVSISLPNGTLIGIELPNIVINHPLYWRISDPRLPKVPATKEFAKEWHSFSPVQLREWLIFDVLFNASNNYKWKTYQYGHPVGYKEFVMWFNAQDIPHKIVEWDESNHRWCWPEGGVQINRDLIDLSPFRSAIPPVRYPALMTLGIIDEHGHIPEDKVLTLTRSATENSSPLVQCRPRPHYRNNPFNYSLGRTAPSQSSPGPNLPVKPRNGTASGTNSSLIDLAPHSSSPTILQDSTAQFSNSFSPLMMHQLLNLPVQSGGTLPSSSNTNTGSSQPPASTLASSSSSEVPDDKEIQASGNPKILFR
ncbi:hypothetical protein Agabi119p4_2442 [Agaricus bisporus var. burnettii]|uniref:Uncharacterized protein n=1 Tax=Agaricus bisporus var. burnettii TaxID=192524 RepID=A0A8H7F914_AGABI|nr:hypothetical protein Agabi119p4_2442 [Agaricus bisporus var. burnettii]